ncbi:MAG: hypothetical protein ACXU9B_00745 [Reyranella sp.]
MDNQPGTEARASNAPGTLAKFHLGLAADGTSCVMVFVDEQQRSIASIAGFPEILGFIASLQRMAAEMARRRALLVGDDGGVEEPALDTIRGAMNIASADFRMADDGCIVGSMVGEGGQAVGIRMRPDVANEMTRNLLRAAPVASAC